MRMSHITMGIRPSTVAGVVMRQRNILFTVCLVSLATIWSCRVPKMCLYRGYECNPTSSTSNTIDLSQVTAPFISWPLQRVCKEATWNHPGVVFICDDNSGGIGNIRNYMLTCVRYAIEAGATGLVLPRIRTRSSEDLADLTQPHEPFSYFFDEGHFRQGLQSSCPLITIYNSTDDIPHAVSPFQAEHITPNNLGMRAGCDQRELNKHSDTFGKQFRAHLDEVVKQFSLPPTSLDHPRAFRLNWGVQWDWPVYRDGPEFVATFGGVLRFRTDILDLGAKTVEYMRQFAAASGGGKPSFAGMHLRTESDALSNWPDFGNQSTAYLERAAGMGFNAAYLATGNGTEADKLARTAAEGHGIEVITKSGLLKEHPEELKLLEGLTWDQQALVDFIVLVESDYFLGVSPSSFSMNVALKRHLKMEGIYTRPWKIGGEGDGRSRLVGSYEKYWDDWLFMYESLWP